MKTMSEIAQQIHANNKEKGFYDTEKNIGEMLALIHSEVSEALEADRKEMKCNISPIELRLVVDNLSNGQYPFYYKTVVKGTFDEEMADIIIRVLDLCAYKGIDIDAHVAAKIRYNSLREYKHGKKY